MHQKEADNEWLLKELPGDIGTCVLKPRGETSCKVVCQLESWCPVRGWRPVHMEGIEHSLLKRAKKVDVWIWGTRNRCRTVIQSSKRDSWKEWTERGQLP